MNAEAREMNFDELWEQIWEHMNLPNAAKVQLPSSLSDKTKQKLLLCNKSVIEIASITEKIVEDINQGSIESIDSLM